MNNTVQAYRVSGAKRSWSGRLSIGTVVILTSLAHEAGLMRCLHYTRIHRPLAAMQLPWRDTRIALVSESPAQDTVRIPTCLAGRHVATSPVGANPAGLSPA